MEVAGQEGLAEGGQELAVDPLAVAEPDLDLGRVDVDVDLLGRDFQVEERHGRPADHQEAAERLGQGVAERAVADVPAAQEEELALGARPALRGVADVAPEVRLVVLALDPEQRLGQLPAEEDADPLLDAGDRREVVEDLAARPERQVDRRVGQGDPGEHLDDVAGLGRVGLEVGPPDRRVVEQVADLDHRADRAAAGPDRAGHPGVDRDLRARLGVLLAGLAADLGDLGDRRQGLAPEPQGPDPEQVLGLGQLARGVRGEGQREVLGGHPLAVVGHPDQVLPAPLDRHVDPGRPGVDGVLQQLLDHARRPLDHLARRDLVDHRRGQLADDPHRPPSLSTVPDRSFQDQPMSLRFSNPGNRRIGRLATRCEIPLDASLSRHHRVPGSRPHDFRAWRPIGPGWRSMIEVREEGEHGPIRRGLRGRRGGRGAGPGRRGRRPADRRLPRRRARTTPCSGDARTPTGRWGTAGSRTARPSARSTAGGSGSRPADAPRRPASRSTGSAARSATGGSGSRRDAARASRRA